MTREEFLKYMSLWNVPDCFYNLGEPVKDTALNLLKISEDEYTVFYQEKGEINDRQIFFTYEEALEYRYQVIKNLLD